MVQSFSTSTAFTGGGGGGGLGVALVAVCLLQCLGLLYWCGGLHGLGLLLLGVKVVASGGQYLGGGTGGLGVVISATASSVSSVSVCLLHVSHMVSSVSTGVLTTYTKKALREGHGLGGLLGGGID